MNSLRAPDWPRRRVKNHQVADKKPPDDWSPCMADLVFVILTAAFFALASLILKGVERL